MMKADYDSQADAVSVELCRFDHFDDQYQVDDDYCTVGFAQGRPVNVALLNPAEHLELLEVAAERYELDAVTLVAAVQAALAAPDRVVTLKVSAQLAA
jgi:hypothetical protein